jgi:hypothetical protein
LPIAGVVRDIIAEAPVGAGEKRIREAVRKHAGAYIELFEGTAKKLRPKKAHSPESDLARAATVAREAFDKIAADEKKGGYAAAIAAFEKVFDAKLGDVIREAFGGGEKSDSNQKTTPNPNVRSAASGNFSRRSDAESTMAEGEIAHIESIRKTVGDFPEWSGAEAEESLPQGAPASDSQCSEPTEPDEVQALAAFRSVGCENFEWFYLVDETKKQGAYHRTTGETLAAEISEIVGDAERGGDSFIIRARGPVLQLDDCEPITASLLEPFAFAVIETSRSNYQVWLAFNDDEDKAAARDRLFAGVKSILPSTINSGSGGATRWPGSINFKPERNGWRVQIHSLAPGRIVTPSELEDAGLLADPDAQAFEWTATGPAGDWPDYKRCLESKTVEGRADRSAADAQFVFFALKRRIEPEAIAKKLLELSDKAKGRHGAKYAARTVASGLRYFRQWAALGGGGENGKH